jgi:hypothetical protein
MVKNEICYIRAKKVLMRGLLQTITFKSFIRVR